MNNDFRISDFDEKDDLIEKRKKYNFSYYIEDNESLMKILTYKRSRDNKLYHVHDIIEEGIFLLKKKYPNIERNRVDIPFKRGRRHDKIDDRKAKQSSFFLSTESINFINDYKFYRVNELHEFSYSKYELFQEFTKLLKEKYKEIFQ